MNQSVILEDSRALLVRSSEHLTEFVSRYQGFARHGIGNFFERADPEIGGKCWGLRVTRTIPRSCTVVLYDVVNTLRSALDHAVYEASVKLGHPDPSKTKFPFADTAAGVVQQIHGTRNGRGGAVDGVAPDLDDCLVGLRPHGAAGGDHMLWGLNKLRNLKNHRKMVRLGYHPNEFRIRGVVSTGPLQIVHEWTQDQEEFIYMRSPDAETKAVVAQRELGIIPLFVDVPALGGQAAVATLYDLLEQLTAHVRAIEAATFSALQKRQP